MPKADSLFLGAPENPNSLQLDDQIQVYNDYQKFVPDKNEKFDIHDLFKDYSKNLKKQPGFKSREK